MSGHSKWHNIKHQKGRKDAQRAKVFTKLGRELTIAARDGGGDPDMNPTLRLAIERARAQNMPNTNIDRAIKRGTGETKGDNLESYLYEGYGPGGIPLLIQTITDNRNRTVSDIRYILDHNGGQLADPGSVTYQFKERGVLYATPTEDVDNETVELEAIDAGANDLLWHEGILRIVVPREKLHVTRQTLEESSALTINDAGIEWMAKSPISDPHDAALSRLLEDLDDNDDVVDIYTPFNE